MWAFSFSQRDIKFSIALIVFAFKNQKYIKAILPNVGVRENLMVNARIRDHKKKFR